MNTTFLYRATIIFTSLQITHLASMPRRIYKGTSKNSRLYAKKKKAPVRQGDSAQQQNSQGGAASSSSNAGQAEEEQRQECFVCFESDTTKKTACCSMNICDACATNDCPHCSAYPREIGD